MLNMCQCLFIISFIFGSTGLYVNENGMSLYVWVYNILKVMVCLGGQLSQFFSYSRFIVALYKKVFY